MPSTYTTNNGIELIGNGEQSGTWGDTTNTNLELLDASLDGQVTITLSSAGTSGSPNGLPITNGTASNGRNRMVIFNDGSDLGATAYVQLTPNDSEKIMFIRNALSGSRDIIVFQGTYNASNDYVVPNGTTAVVYFDGAGTGAVAANVFNNAAFDGLQLGTSDVSVNKILDQDDMSGNDASALATQQSIKAYVDSQVGTVDTLAEILANGNATGGTDIAVGTGDDITFADSSKAIFGAGSDLQIYHDGSNSRIQDAGTGNLLIRANAAVQIENTNGDNMLFANAGGSVDLYHNNSKKLATTSTGIDVTGTVTADGLTVNKGSDGSDIVSLTGASSGRYLNIQSFENSGAAGAGYDLNATSGQGAIRLSTVNLPRLFVENNGDISFYEDTGTTAQMVWDASADALTFGDGVKATFGAGSDLEIYHDGSNSFVKDSGTGSLILQGDNSVQLRSVTGNQAYFYGAYGGSAYIYHAGSTKLATTSTGVDVYGDANFGDNDKAIFGASSDLEIYHNGANSVIRDVGTGDLQIRGTNLRLLNASGENFLYANSDGSVSLYYDNSAKFGTRSTGVNVTGDITLTGTVDGRDVAADGTKLDGIEAAADVTDATNVAAAGAVMTSGSTMTGNLSFGDNDKAIFGAGSDLQIYHDGSNSYVKDAGDGVLNVQGSSQVNIGGANGTIGVQFVEGANVTLRHNNAAKLTTTSGGIDVTGTVTADGLTVNKGSDGSDIVSLTGASSGRYLNIQSFENSGAAGAGYDLNATSGQGAIRLSTVNLPRLFVENNGDISFYEDTGTTAQMVWDASADALTFGDSVKATFGAGNDLEIYHDGSNSYVKDAGTGDLKIQGAAVSIETTGGNLYFKGDANVATLYHTNAAKLATTSTGIDVTGSVVSDGLTSQIATTGRSTLATFQNSALLAAGNQATIELKNSGQSAFISAESAQANAGVDLLFSSNDGTGTETNRMRIAENGDISFYEDTGTTPKLFWDASAESLGIGTTSPGSKLDVNGSITTDGLTSSDPITVSRNADNMLVFDNTGASDDWTIKVVDTDDTLRFTWGAGDIYNFSSGATLPYSSSVVTRGNGDGRYLQLSGGTLTGATTVETRLTVGTGAAGSINGDELALSKDQTNVGMSILSADGTGQSRIYFGSQTDTQAAMIRHNEVNNRLFVQSKGDLYFQVGGTNTRMTLNTSGDLDVTGALSKGSGSFKIDHPLKPDTHHLVHSFIEGPQADNIYRGRVDLVDGTATVNLDTAGRMTEGTFVALNGNVQCLTTNEQGWTAVRGSVSGNLLTIEAQDATCTDTVSWMVIGERHDQHMIDTHWTDDTGRVITEPEKAPVEQN